MYVSEESNKIEQTKKNSYVSDNRTSRLKEETLQKRNAAMQMKNEQKKEEKTAQNGVSMSLSAEGLDRFRQMKMEKAEKQSLQEQVKDSKEAAKAFGEIAKMMEVARRISNGDKVPPSDEQKLMEFDSDLYQAAKAASILQEGKKHKEYDSIFEEEEDSQENCQSLEADDKGSEAVEGEGASETSLETESTGGEV